MASTVIKPIIFLMLLLIVYTTSNINATADEPKWIQSGYWITVSEYPLLALDSSLFTHLFCGFAAINSTTYHLSIPSSDLQYFSSFTSTVKHNNPSIQTLLSVGDSRISPIFFSMISNSSFRKSFINSCIQTALSYGFNGLDLFYFLPNTTLDSSNMAALFHELRSALDSYHKDLILTMGIHYLPTNDDFNHPNNTTSYVDYPVNAIQKNFDWVHMLSFDYYVPNKDNFSYFHAALYDPHNPHHLNTDYGVNQWISRGLTANKILMGLPYHGWAWTLLNPHETHVGARASGPGVTLDGSMSYSYIKNYVKSYGVNPEYNSTYVENSCTFGSFWVGFDDVEAIRTKVSYARNKGLGGYSAFQVGNDDNWVLSQAAAEVAGGNKHRKRLLLEALVPVACIICCISLVIYLFKTRLLHYARSVMTDAENFSYDSSDLKVFRFKDIQAATDKFSDSKKLGEGGYGPVYKGKLKTGQEIAVKRLSKVSSQGLEEFKTEVLLTASLQHVNLVKVMGFCVERDEKMLIYEYLPNRSLDSYLYDPVKSLQLDWGKRERIIEGIVQGLLYLQEYSRVTIIHRDIKASNILLDKELNAKISDFGMARIFQKDVYEANTSRIVGTYGYVPPEYVKQGVYSTKYDVYSFGVLLLQVISGKRSSQLYGTDERNLNLLEYAYESFINGRAMEFVDPALDDSSSECKLIRCLQIALLCVQVKQEDRPSMMEISYMLKNESVPIMIPKRPAFSTKPDEHAKPSSSQNLLYSNYDSMVSELEPR